jgi:hypothetical protein
MSEKFAAEMEIHKMDPWNCYARAKSAGLKNKTLQIFFAILDYFS